MSGYRLYRIVYYCGVWLGVAWCGGGYVGLQEAFHHLAASSPPPPPRRTYPYFWERTEYSTENYFLRQKIFCRRGHQSRRPPGTRRLNSIKYKWRQRSFYCSNSTICTEDLLDAKQRIRSNPFVFLMQSSVEESVVTLAQQTQLRAVGATRVSDSAGLWIVRKHQQWASFCKSWGYSTSNSSVSWFYNYCYHVTEMNHCSGIAYCAII